MTNGHSSHIRVYRQLVSSPEDKKFSIARIKRCFDLYLGYILDKRKKKKKDESVDKSELQRLRNISARMQKSRKKKAKICCWPFS
jgi:hypothetical protein